MASSPGRAGNYLSIDGGVNPLSTLYIIDEMLRRLKFDIGSEDDIRACDWFDLIIGSGHGGLIALLVGRLQMNTIQAIKAYNSLAAVLATEPTDSKEGRELNMARFVDSFKKVLMDTGYSVDTPMRIGAKESRPCKVAVCALDSFNAVSCQFIRSYDTRGMDDPQCTILQAACVTIASPDAYDPIMVGEEDDRIAYIDAMTGYANPTNEVLKEAEKVFGKNATVATIVSLGSGKLERCRQQQGPITVQLNDILRRTIWDIERVHHDVQNRLQDLGIYHRFNVEDPLPFKEFTKQTTKAHAKAYLQEPFTIRRMDQAINSVRERKGVMILKDLNTISSVEGKYRQRPGVVPFFVGRQDVLDHLHQTHIQTSEGEYPIISVLIGLGGSGKTQIALQFARQFETINPGLPVFFVDASSEDRIKEGYQAIIRSRGIAYRSSTYENALQWLSNADMPWLIIADNADDPDLNLYPFVPRYPRGHFIVTTRNVNQALMARTHAHHIEGLDDDHSFKLLLDISGYKHTDLNVKQATAIVDVLGHLPLAIVQAAGYIYKNQCLSTYLKLYDESREKFLAHRTKELPHEYNLSVGTTLEMSFEKLPIRSKQALSVLSFLHNTSISHGIIEIAAGNKFFYASGKASEADTGRLNEIRNESDALCKIFCPGGQWSEPEFYEVLEPCFQYSLLQRIVSIDNQKFYSMHILVQSWLQTRPITDEQFSSRSLAKRMLLATVREGSLFQYFHLHQAILPHIRKFTGQSLGIVSDDALLYRVLSDCGDDLTAMIHIVPCVNRLNITVECVERLKALRDLTWTLVLTGRSNEAVKTGEEAVALCTRSLGKDDPVLLMSMVNLAVAYRSVGRYKDACKLDEEASDQSRRTLGPQHTNTLNAMSSLALDYDGLGDHKKAQDLNRDILSSYKSVLGPEHPDTLACMGRLALNYRNLGEYMKAQSLMEKTMKLHRRVLGSEHPHTLASMSNLAQDYSGLGEYEKAQKLNEEQLALSKRILGPEHPHTLTSMSNLAWDYHDLREYEKAQKLNEEVLALRKRVLGPEHPHTLASMNNLALNYSGLGEYEKARNSNEEALALYKRILGSEHPHTLISMSNLSQNYSQLRQYEKARNSNKEVLALRKRVLGPEHPDTLTSMSNLAQNYSDLRCLEETQKILDEKQEIENKKHMIH